MRSSRIKKNSGRSRIDIERTEHDFWFRKHCLYRHMVHLFCIGCWLLRRSLLIIVLTLGCLLILLPRAMVSIMPNFSTMIAYVGGARCDGLHGSVVRCSLSWCLLATLLLGMLIAILLLVQVALRVLTMIPLIGWSLVPLLEALLRIGVQTGITFRGLSLKPPLLGLHLFALIVNNNSAIHQHLEIRVCIGHKLELQTIIQTLEKAALLINIISHLIQSVT